MGKIFEGIIPFLCAIFSIIFILFIEPSSPNIKIESDWIKYFILLSSIFAAIILWMNLNGKFDNRNLK